jgi:hypothetical protein
MTNRLFLAIMLFASVLALKLNQGIGTVVVGNDGCQYLDAAANAGAGQGLVVNLAHFDEQVNYGRFPVPFTHFAPGYPWLISVFSRLGMGTGLAAWLISALAFVATTWLIWDAGISLGAHAGVAALFSILWITHANALSFASMATAETPFTFLFAGMIALMARDLRAEGKQPVILILVGLTAAASYWVRYPGLFLIPPALLYIAWRAWRSRETFAWAIAACVATVLTAAVIPVRNIHYMGSWQGGFTAGAGHSVRMVVVETVKASYHEVFGDRVVARPDIWIALAFVSLAAVAYFAWRSRKTAPKFLPAAAVWIAIVIAAYMGGVMLSALRSIASDFERYYLPAYPALLILGAALSLARSRVQYLALGLLIAGIVGVEGKSLFAPNPFTHTEDTMRAILDQETAPGVTIGAWLRANTVAGESIVSVDGQILHYFVERPVISIIEPVFSSRPTDEAAFHDLMRARRARFLVVMPDAPKDEAPEQEAIPFLANLANGIAPAWLRASAHTRGLAVFECAACVAR